MLAPLAAEAMPQCEDGPPDADAWRAYHFAPPTAAKNS